MGGILCNLHIAYKQIYAICILHMRYPISSCLRRKQLIDQIPRLSLDDRLARWFPQMPNAAHITIDQLLSHRSGLAINAGDPLAAFVSRAAQLRQAADTPSLFCPGADAAYSNTGYLLLGLIVDDLLQRSVH
jgi:D-alanyl-D-alanine carboxypeptidase